MGSVYIVLIFIPIVFIMALSFIFQSGVSEIEVQQLKLNCPFPALNKNITNVSLEGTIVTYDETELDASTDSYVTIFRCAEDNTLTVTTSFYTFASGIFDAQQAFLGYLSASISALGAKVSAFTSMIYLFVNAPAEATAQSFFTYINAILFGAIGFGIYLAIRSGAG